MKKLITLIFLLIVNFSFLIISKLPVSAHPMPLIVQEHTFTFSKDKLTMEYKFSMEPLVSDRFYPVIDTNNDGTINDEEIDKFSDEMLKQWSGRLNNKDLKFKKVSHTVIPKSAILSFQNQIKINYEIVEPKILETNSFMFRTTKKFVEDDPNGDLITFNDNMINNPDFNRLSSEVNIESYYEFVLDYKINNFQQTSSQNTSTPKEQTSQENIFKKFFNWTSDASKRMTGSIFESKNTGIAFLIVSLLIAFIAGSLHAITPGHGKSMMAAFLIGKGKSKFTDVCVLGLSITVAHTIVIFVLGFVLLYLKKTEMINRILPYFEKVSAALLIILALNLLNKAFQSYRHYRYHKVHNNHHAHHHDNHDHEHHTHTHKHDHSHHHDEIGVHSHFGIKHTHHIDEEKVKIRNKYDLFIAGLGGGVVPCVDALSLLILSVHLNRIAFGLVLILAFSLGLAAAIIAVGMLLVHGKNKLKFEDKFGHMAEIYSPLITGLFILAYAMKFIF